MTPADVVKLIKEKEVRYADLRFTDTRGKEQHVTVPSRYVTEELFVEGKMFDGSSIAGWKGINESDMILMPDASTAVMDPFFEESTVNIRCDIVEPATMQGYERDPRSLGKRAEAYMKSTGIADTAYFGPENEFFIFDSVKWGAEMRGCFAEIDSVQGAWNSGRDYEDGNRGHRPGVKGGYFPVPPVDAYQDIRSSMCMALEEMGLKVEVHHHEVATGGQCEIGVKFSTLLKAADNLLWYKYVVKNMARKAGKTATFMPKPLFGDNGSGMHVHQSIWKGGQPLFAGDGYAGLSETALYYIGGIIKHAKSLAALTNPTTNSYRRLVPGFEAPVNLAYSHRNRSASCRIPISGPSPKAKRVEIRFPDPSCNPYLAFSAMLMAGLDGIQNKINPGDPLDKDIYALSPEELKSVPKMPGSLEESLDALEADHEYLLRGGVFTKDVIEEWLDYKRTRELNPIRMRPTPHEFTLYYDI